MIQLVVVKDKNIVEIRYNYEHIEKMLEGHIRTIYRRKRMVGLVGVMRYDFGT